MGLLDFNNPEVMQGLMLMQGRKGQLPGLLQTIMQMQDAQKQRALQEQSAKLQQKMSAMQIAEMERTNADRERLRGLLSGGAAPAPQVPPQTQPVGQNFVGANPEYQPSPMALPGPKGMPPAVTSRGDGSKASLYQKYMGIADKLESGGLPERAVEYRTLADKYRPKLKDTKTLTDPATQQRVTVNFFEDGTHEVVPFSPDKEKLHFADTGGAITGLDPFTGNPAGAALPKTMSPSDKDASSRGWAGIGLQRDQFNRGTYDADRGGFVTPGSFAGVPGLPGGSKAREDSDGLRKEFNALPEVKNYRDISAIYNAAKKAPDTPAGDFALIYGVGKILDPGSVVREGEMSMVMAAGSPAQRVQGYLNVLRGKGRLTPELRNELRMMLNNAASERKTLYEKARETYGKVATQRGYNPDEVFIASPGIADPSTSASPTQPLSTEEQAELARLRQKHRRQ